MRQFLRAGRTYPSELCSCGLMVSTHPAGIWQHLRGRHHVPPPPTRRCPRCEKVKPRSEFDGPRLSYCKPCRHAVNKEYRKTPRGAATQKAARDKYRRKPQWLAYWRDYYRRQKVKALARQMVYRAVKSGRLKRLPCESCGVTKDVHAHHDDYTKPLKVDWYCRRCHNAAHAGAA